jgi:uncharacterized coiled-coil protein SlyX
MPRLKQLTIADAEHMRLGHEEELLVGDAIFFAPARVSPAAPDDAAASAGTAAAGADESSPAAADNAGGGKPDGAAQPLPTALLSVGIVVATGPTLLVVHELLRPNPMQWCPSAWAPNPNVLFPTGVRVLVEREAVRARAVVKPAGSGAQVLVGGETSSLASLEATSVADRPFVLAADSTPVPSASHSAFLWASLDGLRTRAAESEGALARQRARLERMTDEIREALAAAEASTELRTKRQILWTDQRFAERDAFIMRELAAVTRAADRARSDAGARESALEALTRADADKSARLERVEAMVTALQGAQARINEKSAAQLHDGAARTSHLEQGLSACGAQTEGLADEVAEMAAHFNKRIAQLTRQLNEAREEIDALTLGGERAERGGGGGGGALGGAAKRTATGALVPRAVLPPRAGRAARAGEAVRLAQYAPYAFDHAEPLARAPAPAAAPPAADCGPLARGGEDATWRGDDEFPFNPPFGARAVAGPGHDGGQPKPKRMAVLTTPDPRAA